MFAGIHAGRAFRYGNLTCALAARTRLPNVAAVRGLDVGRAVASVLVSKILLSAQAVGLLAIAARVQLRCFRSSLLKRVFRSKPSTLAARVLFPPTASMTRAM